MLNELTVVVSPLVALILDQVAALRLAPAGLRCVAVNRAAWRLYGVSESPAILGTIWHIEGRLDSSVCGCPLIYRRSLGTRT